MTTLEAVDLRIPGVTRHKDLICKGIGGRTNTESTHVSGTVLIEREGSLEVLLRLRNREGSRADLVLGRSVAKEELALLLSTSENLIGAFAEACEWVRTKSVVELSDELKLRAYALYKQGSIGDNNMPYPGVFSFRKRAMWDAWDRLRGTTRDNAMLEYILLVGMDMGSR